MRVRQVFKGLRLVICHPSPSDVMREAWPSHDSCTATRCNFSVYGREPAKKLTAESKSSQIFICAQPGERIPQNRVTLCTLKNQRVFGVIVITLTGHISRISIGIRTHFGRISVHVYFGGICHVLTRITQSAKRNTASGKRSKHDS